MSTSRQTRLPDSRQQEYLDTGTTASAWLSERTDASTSRVTLEWDFAQLDTKDVNLGWSAESERLHTGDSELHFTHAGGTQLQSLYSSARFLDSNYNGDFISHDCLIEPLLEASRASRASSTQPRGALSLCRLPSTRPDRPSSSYLLAFPSGSRRNKLTALCLDSQDTKHAVTSALNQQILAASATPMEQVSSISEKDGKCPFAGLGKLPLISSWLAGILVGTRNASSVVLYRVGFQRQQNDDEIKLSCRVLASFSGRDLAHARPLDFCLQHFSDSTANSSKALIIDDTGSIWQTAKGRDLKKAAARGTLLPGLDKLRHGGHSNYALEWARISYGLNEYQAVAALATCVRFFDLQDPSSDRTLLDLNEGKSRILDLVAVPAGAQESPIRVLATDKEVIWLDIRKAANPVLRYKHRREEAMDLRLSAVCDGGILRTVLWSPSNCVMTLFSTPLSAPVQLLHPPYDLRGQAFSSSCVGLALLPPDRPSRKKKPKHRAIQVAGQLADGTVIHTKLETNGASETLAVDLAAKGFIQPAGPDLKKASMRDLSRTYRSIFFTGSSLSQRSSLPTSLKIDDDISLRDQAHVLLSALLSTSCDDHGSEHTAVANFASVSALDRDVIALETLQQDIDSIQQLEEAPFRFTIGEILNAFEASEDGASFAKKLRTRYGLKSGIYVVKHRDVQESHLYACEQVAMDLALSKTVFASTHPLSPPNELVPDIDVSSYKTISELPPLEYGYLKPVPQPGLSSHSAGAQALLCEWNLGADPSARPSYINPYDKCEKTVPKDGQLEAYRVRIAEGTDMSASQPLPGPSRVAVPTRKPKVVDDVQQEGSERHQSQLAVPAYSQTQTQQASQAIPMPFSQVVPGPHGGRPIKKKRVGGF